MQEADFGTRPDTKACSQGATWPRWLRWIERLIMIQAFCSIVPAHVLGWPGAGYRYWMYVSLALLVGVTIRRIVSLERMRPRQGLETHRHDADPTHLDINGRA